MSIDCSLQRRHRAASVSQLSALREDGRHVQDPRWNQLDWPSLQRLPTWCALEASSRQRYLCIAGALVLSPDIRRCLRGETLVQLREFIGVGPLHWIQRRPYVAAACESLVELAEDDLELRQQLLSRGIPAVVRKVEEPVMRGLLFDVLGSLLLDPDTSMDRARAGVCNDASGTRELEIDIASIAAELHASVEDEHAGTDASEPRVEYTPAGSERSPQDTGVARRIGAVKVTSTRIN